MSTSRLIAAFIAVVVALSTASAFAQDADPAAAKDHYDRGAVLYFEGEYAQAVLEFMRAYDALAEPVFMYNIAMSHWRLGNYDKAIDASEITLRAELDEKLRAQVQARAVVFYRLRHITEADWTASPLEPEPEPEPELVAEAYPNEDRPHTLRWVGGGLGVVGIGLLTGFAVLEVGLQSKVSDYEAAAAAGDAGGYTELQSEIDDTQPVSLALLWSGVGLVAIGGGLLAWDLSRGPSESVSVRVWPGGAAVRLAW